MTVSDATENWAHRDDPSLAPGAAVRAHFPIFADPGPAPLAYLDTAASSQKPRVVIERLAQYLGHEHANIHRGAYRLSAQSTEFYEAARGTVARFIGAADPRNVIFTRGTTESINLVARAAEHLFHPGDSLLLTLLEHHSNIVPWQLLGKRRGVQLHFADVTDRGELRLEHLEQLLVDHRPKLVAVTHLSNALGTLVPVAEIIALAHSAGAMVLLDAAQSVAHHRLKVTELGADFVAFSGHKLYGPTGIGVLYISPRVIDRLEPFQGGGDMIRTVAVEGSTWAESPQKFEAGTPAIGEAIALGTAIDFVESVGLDRIRAHEQSLFRLYHAELAREPGLVMYGPGVEGGEQESILSFNIKGVHPHDLSTIADAHNVQLRGGHHCAMPLLKRLGIQSSARASLGMYSTEGDLRQLLDAVRAARKLFG